VNMMTGDRHQPYRAVYGKRKDGFEVARRRMVSEQIVRGGVTDECVLAAMSKVPRHEFVGQGMQDQAYLDRPLPIGLAQTISQPLIVALMTEALELKGHERVLEIGTGSGYQAAILSELAKEIYTIERKQALSIAARKVLYRLHYDHIKFRVGDGTLGWPEEAPFDGIIVTAGGPEVPMALRQQLADGGRMLIPVGEADVQHLEVIIRHGNEFKSRYVTACRFVKLVGSQGWNEGE
jgi:protein-L-isoaspartate(D-aspartate) O-methyltransferase